MKRILNICFIAALVVLSSSCQRQLGEGSGYLTFRASVNDATIDITATTKATTSEAFQVAVVASDGTKVTDFTLEPGAKSEPMELKRGVYNVTASLGEDVEAAFDSPYYYGETSFTVRSSASTEVALDCSLANDRISVEVSDALRQAFSEFSAELTTVKDATSSLLYTYTEIDAEREGYLKCRGVIYVEVKATNNDGDKFSTTYTIQNVEPRTHLTLSFNVSNQYAGDGAGIFDLRVDRTYTDVDSDINANLSVNPITITEASGADLSHPILCPEGVGEIGLFTFASTTSFLKIYLIHNNSDFTAKGLDRKHNLLQSAPEGISVTQTAETEVQVDLRSFFATALPYGNYDFKLAAIDSDCNWAEAAISVTVASATTVATKTATATCYTITVSGVYYTEQRPEGIAFLYKETTSADWSRFEGDIAFDGTAFKATITGLKANTSYNVLAITATENLPATGLVVTTGRAEQPYNFGFDEWWINGKAWYPNLDDAHHYWDTANAGATLLGGNSSTYPDESHVVKGKACCMESIALVGVFAGGNVYSGKFVDRQGTTAILDQGQPFTCRPKALKGYYDYSPATINKTKSPYGSLNGQPDQALIYAYLADWDKPHRVKSGDESTYVDLDNDPSIIGIAQLVVTEGTNGQYKAFVQNFEYRNDKTPTYLVVTCTSSRYADYFTGGVGSKLWVDEFEFIYE